MRSTQQAVRVSSTQVSQGRSSTRDRVQFAEPSIVDPSDSTISCSEVSSDRLETGLEHSWLMSLVHSSPDLIGTVSFDGRWLFMNQAGQGLLGFHGLEPNHRITLLETLFEDDQGNLAQDNLAQDLAQDGGIAEVLSTALQSGHWQGRLHFKHTLTGRTIATTSQWFVVRDQYTHQPLCFATISQLAAAEPFSAEATDSTLNPSLNQSVVALQDALRHEKKLNQLKSRFLADIAHELRSPLTVIASSANILETMNHPLQLGRIDFLHDAKQQKHFQRIQKKVNQMAQLLEDLLLLSCTEQNQVKFQPVSTDLIQFCTELVEEAQISTDQHQIIFSPRCGGQKCIQKLNANVDTRLLRRILVNLLSNSIKYSPNEDAIYIDLDHHSNMLVIQIRDTGIGIPLEDQQRLFNSFYRASNVEKIPGTGLGLTIVKQAVELHHGSIQFNSEVGIGTTVTVILPTGQN